MPNTLLVLLALAAPLEPGVGTTGGDAAGGPASPEAVRATAERVEKIRGLPFRRPVRVVRVDAAAARAVLEREIDEDLAPGQWADRGRLLSELGLLPRDYALRERLLELVAEQVVGFYIPRTKELAIVNLGPDAPPELRALAAADSGLYDAVLPHELAHALLDQHVDLARVIDAPELAGRDDVLFARHALAEGDAMLVMLIASLEKMGLAATPETVPDSAVMRAMANGDGLGFPELKGAPPFVRAQVLEPYLLGLDLVQAAWRTGGWRAVDALWKSPPSSSEQLLHPDRRGDAPTEVPPDDVPSGWALRQHVELGELTLRAWLESKLPAADAAAAAAGWDGDRALLLARPFAPPPGDPLRYPQEDFGVLLRTVWDSPADAQEFGAAAERWLALAAGGDDDDWSVRRQGTRVEVFFRRAPVGEVRVEPIDPDPWDRSPSSLR